MLSRWPDKLEISKLIDTCCWCIDENEARQEKSKHREKGEETGKFAASELGLMENDSPPPPPRKLGGEE